MAANELEEVTRLWHLSQEPDKRSIIVKEHRSLPGLVVLLGHSQSDVVNLAVETLYNLALYEGNKDPMMKEPGLILSLRKSTHPKASTIVAKIDYIPSFLPARSNIIRMNSNQNNNNADIVNEQVGLSVFSEKVANKLAAAKTHTFYIKGMNNFTKPKVEETLVGIKGVVSFLIDIHTHKAVVRTMTDPDVIISAIRGAGLSATIGDSDTSKDGDGPDYLPEGTQAKGVAANGWGSLVTFGSKPGDGGGEQSGWGWGKVAKAFWG